MNHDEVKFLPYVTSYIGLNTTKKFLVEMWTTKILGALNVSVNLNSHVKWYDVSLETKKYDYYMIPIYPPKICN